jgi:hypothetical protein
MTESLIKPKRPVSLGWRQVKNPNTAALDSMSYPHTSWIHEATGLFAISALEVVSDPGQPALGPEYHLSVSMSGQRCSTADALFVLNEFDLLDAKEDNHVPSGRVRNFWRPVADHLSEYECPCVDDEPTIKEDKGDFVWRGVTR